MEQKKEIKISLKHFIIIIMCVLFLLIIGVILFLHNRNNQYYKVTVELYNAYRDVNNTNFQDIINNTKVITNYNEYKQIIEAGKKCENIHISKSLPNSIFFSNNIAVVHCSRTSGDYYTRILSLKEEGNTLIVDIYCSDNTLLAKSFYDIYFIPVSKDITTIDYNISIPERESKCIDFDEKPLIYLYPQEEETIEISLGYPNKITSSYPKYMNNWIVLAKPNGILEDINTHRQLYALYYESENATKFNVENEGFIVKSENIYEFLEEKLAILGLTEREAEEFIIYWLPRLEASPYNYIRFATEEEINKNMPLEINPNPDTVIRVLMTFKGLYNPIEVQEQQLTAPKRKGFVAVEWGGTEIK